MASLSAASDPMASLSALIGSSDPAPAASSSASSAAPGGAAEDSPLAVLSAALPVKAPVVVCCGATAFADTGDAKKMAAAKLTTLLAPHRLVGTALDGVAVRDVVSGPCAGHTVALTDGGVFAWGKNHRGQLGVGDEEAKHGPCLVDALKKETVVHAACGKAHTIFITAKGQVYAAGENKFGAVGPGCPKKKDTASEPVLVPGIAGAVRAAAGDSFSMVVTSSGALYSFGWSEFGQLGHGTDGSFNQSASSIKMTYEAERTPLRVPGLAHVVQVACGPHHCVALQANGVACSWGCGGYGRLGHVNQDDVYSPKPLPNFLFRAVACGNAWSCGVGWRVYNAAARPAGGGILHVWGRMNPTKDSAMYPKPEYDLQGWEIQALACGNTHTVVAADGSTIAWGSGTGFGELGLTGPGAAKSSAKPKKVDALEGAGVGAIAAGLCHTMWLADGAHPSVLALPTFTPLPDAPVVAAPKGKNKAAAAPKGGAGKKAKK